MELIDSLKEAVLNEIAEQLIPFLDVAEMFKDKWESMDTELKAEFEEQQVIANKAFEEQRKEMIKGLEIKWNALNSALTCLVNSTTQFAMRLALIPPAIISVTPIGPGVAANAIPQAVAQLKNDGEMVGKVYDETKNNLSDLVGNIEGGSVGVLKDLVSGLLSTAALALAIVGISKDGVPAEDPKVESPIPVPDLEAADCSNFDPIVPHTNPNPPPTYTPETYACENCRRYEEMIQGNERSCNNCKNYKKSE